MKRLETGAGERKKKRGQNYEKMFGAAKARGVCYPRGGGSGPHHHVEAAVDWCIYTLFGSLISTATK